MANVCPKFDHCGAPVCPLDHWKSHYHVRGEPVCFYLREIAKHGGALPPTGYMASEFDEKVSEAYREIISSPCSAFGDIRRRLHRAALSPSKHNADIGSHK